MRELTNGHSNKKYYKAVSEIARGVPEFDIRARVGDVCQDANEQVKCLINLATDPRVLGVTFFGWSPFA